VLRRDGHVVREVAKLGEEAGGLPGMVGLIESGEVALVVNTPSPSSGPVRDAAQIRHTAIAQNVLCLTSVETAVAAAGAMDQGTRERVAEVRPLAEWLLVTGQ